MGKIGDVKVRVKLSQFRADPVQYAPYNPTLIADNLFIVALVPANEVEIVKNGKVTEYNLTPMGAALVYHQLSKAIMQVYTGDRK